MGIAATLVAEDSVKQDFSDIKRLFKARGCFDCHRGTPTAKRVPLDNYKALVRLKLVEPGNADESGLVIALELDEDDPKRMPPRQKNQENGEKKTYIPLTEAEIEGVRRWIEEGAPENRNPEEDWL